MNHNRKEYQKHLTLSDRIYIEQGLLQHKSFKEIAAFLYKDPTTISKEIRRSRETQPVHRTLCHDCRLFNGCHVQHLCEKHMCYRLCKNCRFYQVQHNCSHYDQFKCDIKVKPPYVCNGCADIQTCALQKIIYSAKHAQKRYEQTLSESRTGISLTLEELKAMDELITPLVKKGQPLSHIFAVHSEDIPCSRRTLYNYFDQSILTARNIDLPRRVRYKSRKTKKTESKQVNSAYRNGRTYKEFERYLEQNPDTDVVELDTVMGRQGSKRRLLTMLFRKTYFMLIFLIPDGGQESVARVFDDLTEKLGIETFQKYFPVILTDNGPEFKAPGRLEFTQDGEQRTRIFYCDPFISGQKGRLEKNHEYIRYVIPKGRSFAKYTQKDSNLLASHINSTARDGLNGKTPFDMAELLLDKRIPVIAGQFRVSPDEVLLKPELINK